MSTDLFHSPLEFVSALQYNGNNKSSAAFGLANFPILGETEVKPVTKSEFRLLLSLLLHLLESGQTEVAIEKIKEAMGTND